MALNAYENLRVWQEAVALSRTIYNVSATFPKVETFGLVSQMRRSSVSVASNIAEGSARNSKKEFRHFVGIAIGSLAELDTQLVIAHPLFIDDETCSHARFAVENLRKMLMGLKNSLTRASIKPMNDQPLTINESI